MMPIIGRSSDEGSAFFGTKKIARIKGSSLSAFLIDAFTLKIADMGSHPRSPIDSPIFDDTSLDDDALRIHPLGEARAGLYRFAPPPTAAGT